MTIDPFGKLSNEAVSVLAGVRLSKILRGPDVLSVKETRRINETCRAMSVLSAEEVAVIFDSHPRD